MLISSRDVAIRIFGLSDESKILDKQKALSRLAKLGKIPSVKMGKHYYFSPHTFEVNGVRDKPARWLRSVR